MSAATLNTAAVSLLRAQFPSTVEAEPTREVILLLLLVVPGVYGRVVRVCHLLTLLRIVGAAYNHYSFGIRLGSVHGIIA